tara:strand:+ start:1265 stop:1975 length:711 start_codon:yes stop_codon:yes gene_type:complete
MRLLIDGDPIVYRIAFASQKKQEDGSVKADPESYTLHSCKLYMSDLVRDTECKSYKVFLSGKPNFRDKVRADYKGNRSKAVKPIHYQLIRDYLEERYKAQIVNGMEADDALGLVQEPDHSTAIATIDKDLLMVEGLHYNYNTREWKTVSAEEGTRFFYKQMLTGDRVDNITGIRGIGDKKADKLLDNNDDWDKLIVDMYLDEFDNGFQRAVENSQLLWMLQRGKEMPIDFYEQAKV